MWGEGWWDDDPAGDVQGAGSGQGWVRASAWSRADRDEPREDLRGPGGGSGGIEGGVPHELAVQRSEVSMVAHREPG